MRIKAKKFIRGLACSATIALAPALLPAASPLIPPMPFAPAPAETTEVERALALRAARRAHDLGLLTAAEGLYRQLLDAPKVDREEVGLALATVLLDAGKPAAAKEVLAAVPGTHGAAWELRMGLAALQLRERDLAQASWDAINPDELAEPDRAWYLFLQGALYDTLPNRDGGAVAKANEFYNKARDAATTELAKARFQLAAERVRLTDFAPPTAEQLEQARKAYEQFQGREVGHEQARQYAVKLALADRKDDAVAFLQEQVLRGMPPQERGWRDEFNFLIGMLGDRGRGGAGREALVQLLASGSKPERQRQALQLLAAASTPEPERGHFRAELGRLIAATPPHPIRESLLYFRAQLALAEKDFVTAEEHANRLLRDFPESEWKAHVFGLLTQSAWEQQRFRLAAPNARKAREALPANAPPGSEIAAARADLGVLEAEAWFRAGDYRPAADAYAALLRERPPELSGERLSSLMFQRVLAEIRSGSADAAKVLDELEADPAFRVIDRWQAEWSLARTLQARGKTEEAYARVSRLIGATRAEGAPAADGLTPELRMRMAWLHAKLSFDAGQPQDTLTRVDELLQTVAGIDPASGMEIASTAVLLKARAEFALKRETPALETLNRLRANYPDTEAAIYSYLIEARYYADQEKISEAQLRLTQLIDNPDYKDSAYVPFALFELALLSEGLGQEKDLKEAYKRIEQLVGMAAAAEETDLIFAARMKQGDLLRRMSQFPQAQRAYEDLVNRYSDRPDIVLAQLALADCHNAQSAADPSHAEIAQLLFEQLRDRVDAPADVRVEAGYKLGLLAVRRGQKTKAAEIWWRDVITPFLLENKEPFQINDNRPYWLARTLLELARLHEDMEKLEEARQIYSLVIDTRLGVGPESLAKEGLKRLGLREATL